MPPLAGKCYARCGDPSLRGVCLIDACGMQLGVSRAYPHYGIVGEFDATLEREDGVGGIDLVVVSAGYSGEESFGYISELCEGV